ncbi:hypothetical protein V2J09_014665 [Rumex salicifolius]
MSSPKLGYEDGDDDDDDILFYPPLPPHLEPPSTSFLGYRQQDLSLLFLDNYTQNSPNPLVEDSFIITHEAIDDDELGQGQENGKGDMDGDEKATSSSSLSRMMMKQQKKKKMDHNEKERIRRINLNTAYLALRSSLPESNKPKSSNYVQKKWSAAYLIDRAVDHIPKLEGDIEKLRVKKKDLLLELEKVDDLKRNEEEEKKEKSTSLSICINEVKRGQFILQICHQRNKVDVFSEFLDKLEIEGMEVLNTSVLYPCEERSSHHIHVQIDESSLGAEYVAELKEKLIFLGLMKIYVNRDIPVWSRYKEKQEK